MRIVKFGFTLLFIVCLNASCNKAVHKQDLNIYFAKGHFEIKEKNVLEETGGVGEGFAIEEYEITGSGLERYINNNLDLPDKNDWNKVPWQRLVKSEVLDLGLNYYTKNKRIANKVEQVNKLKNNDNAYFSCYFRSSLSNPTAVILYIVSIEDETIYVIENTI